MSRTILGLPLSTVCLVPHPSRKQLALFSTSFIDRKSFLNLHSRKPNEPSAHRAQFHSAEQSMGSILPARERHPHEPPPFSLSHQCTYTCLDPYNYTSGRWLRRDKLERDSRYIPFDFDALCRRVVELCPGAVSIKTYDKQEGGFNRVFIFTTDNAKRVVARLPFKQAGPPRLTTNSEVATITYREFKSKHQIEVQRSL